MIKATLIKPLDGDPEGTVREFSPADFERLVAKGAVRSADDGDELRQDGPTISEFIAAGYKAENYPPNGFASRSTPEEISVAIAAEGKSGAEKAAPAVENKMAPAVENKSGLSGIEPAAAAKRAQVRKD